MVCQGRGFLNLNLSLYYTNEEKKRSDDFRMFVVEERYPNYNPNTIEFDEFIIINEARKKLEIKTL